MKPERKDGYELTGVSARVMHFKAIHPISSFPIQDCGGYPRCHRAKVWVHP